MRSSNWRFTHQGILLGKGGALIDGQHRMLAIVLTGLGQKFLVSVDEEIESPLNLPLDVGSKRTADFILGYDKHVCYVAALAFRIHKKIQAPSAGELEPYCAVFLDPVESLLGSSGKLCRGISSADIWLAASIRLLLGEDRDYILKSYRAMALNKFEDMSPLIAGFYKQVVVQRVNYDARQKFARALRAFDKSKCHLTKMQIKDEGHAFDEASSLLKYVLHKNYLF
jgi:hypothetical protein